MDVPSQTERFRVATAESLLSADSRPANKWGDGHSSCVVGHVVGTLRHMTGFAVLLLMAVATVVILVGIVVAVIVTTRRRLPDRSAPRVQAEARVVDKRALIVGGGAAADQRYYVTFQLPDGNRVELAVPTPQAGILVVGDQGRLDWQGNHYLGFAREILR